MARKNGTGFGGKVLNFIGLVDDEDPRDTYGDEYETGSYGQRQAYKPQRSQRQQERPRQELVSRSSRYEPTRPPRMDRNAGRSTGYESRYGSARDARGSSSPRRSGAYVERNEDSRGGRYDYSPRPSRFGSSAPSRFDDQGGNLPQQRPNSRQNNAGGRQKTVMYNLYSLADCKEVIDQLILNATVIITMSDLEHGHLQRAVDTLSGAVFALNAKIRKVSEYTYLIAPNSVEVDDAFDSDRDY
jgi:FtsZ-interacting cell division protein YlmF